jgi:hypothetical protein
MVAPHLADLPGVEREIYTVERTAGLLVDRLPPDARHRDLVEKIQGGCYDVLWLATHGMSEGVLLCDDEVLTAGELAALVLRSGVRGVVLNTCSSDEIAESLHDETGADVVCTVVDVLDRMAYQTAALFGEHLGMTGDFRAAFDAARPGRERLYRYIPEYRRTLLIMGPERNIFSSEELRAIYDAISDIRQRLVVVETDLRYMRQDIDRRHDLRGPAQWTIVLFGILISAGMFLLLYLNMVGR